MLSVLIVEDHALLRRLLESDVISMRPDASVTACDSLRDALGCLAAAPCDLVLLDLDLPDAKGLDSLRRIRAATAAALVVVSASDSAQLRRQAQALGASDFLEKGDDLDEFYAGLRRALRVP